MFGILKDARRKVSERVVSFLAEGMKDTTGDNHEPTLTLRDLVQELDQIEEKMAQCENRIREGTELIENTQQVINEMTEELAKLGARKKEIHKTVHALTGYVGPAEEA